MVNIKDDFNASYNLLMHRKKIIIPVLCSLVLPLILVFLFLNLSGLQPLLRELVFVSEEFDQQKAGYIFNTENIEDENYTLALVNYLGRESQSSSYGDELREFLEAKGYDWDRYKELLNIKNLILLIIFLLIGIIGSFYFSCMSYAIIALSIKNQEINFQRLLTVTNRFLFKLLSLRVLTSFIIFAPLIISIVIIISLYYLNTILGVLSTLIFIVLFLLYVFFVGLRLFFTTPALYLEDEGAVKSIKHSYAITKGHLKQVLIIFFMIYGITIFMNSFVGQPLYGTYSSTLFESSWIKISFNFILIILFLVLEAFLFTFQHIFLFYSYIDFKELKEITK